MHAVVLYGGVSWFADLLQQSKVVEGASWLMIYDLCFTSVCSDCLVT